MKTVNIYTLKSQFKIYKTKKQIYKQKIFDVLKNNREKYNAPEMLQIFQY